MASHPKVVNHLAISTNGIKAQLEFFCDVLGYEQAWARFSETTPPVQPS